jgi:hypothetical protein
MEKGCKRFSPGEEEEEDLRRLWTKRTAKQIFL